MTYLQRYEKRVYSQNGEDGVLARLFEILPPVHRHYVEFGTGSGRQCNTRLLRRKGWTGLLMDGGFDNPAIGLHREFITSGNIVGLLEKYDVPRDTDLVSVDIDGQDLHVWRAFGNVYRPQVVVVEFNASLGPDSWLTMPPDDAWVWDGTRYFGSGIRALTLAGNSMGYALAGCLTVGVNLFFVRRDLVDRLPGELRAELDRPDLLYSWSGRAQQPDGLNRKYMDARDLKWTN